MGTLVAEMEAISDALRKALIDEPLSKREEFILFESGEGSFFGQSRLIRFNNQILKCLHPAEITTSQLRNRTRDTWPKFEVR
jgi:hypothetical protein